MSERFLRRRRRLQPAALGGLVEPPAHPLAQGETGLEGLGVPRTELLFVDTDVEGAARLKDFGLGQIERRRGKRQAHPLRKLAVRSGGRLLPCLDFVRACLEHQPRVEPPGVCGHREEHLRWRVHLLGFGADEAQALSAIGTAQVARRDAAKVGDVLQGAAVLKEPCLCATRRGVGRLDAVAASAALSGGWKPDLVAPGTGRRFLARIAALQDRYGSGELAVKSLRSGRWPLGRVHGG